MGEEDQGEFPPLPIPVAQRKAKEKPAQRLAIQITGPPRRVGYTQVVDGLSVELFRKEGSIGSFIFFICIKLGKLSLLCDSLACVAGLLAIAGDVLILVSLKIRQTDATIAIFIRLSRLLVEALTSKAVVKAIVIIIKADSNVGIIG
tara:strand:+ start:215 stop:655 length:441 start_codon:yes stop_codon:yes gene_type:complete